MVHEKYVVSTYEGKVLAQSEYYAIPRVEMQHPSSRASLRKIDAEQKGSSLLRGDKSMEKNEIKELV
jgi:hypothetical protein